MRNILEYLENSAEKYGSKTAAKDDKTSCTYQELKEKAQETGSFLADELTVRKPVVCFMEKSVEALQCFMGIVYAGDFYVLVDPNFPLERIRQIFSVLQPEVVLTQEQYQEKLAQTGYAGKVFLEAEAKKPVNTEKLAQIRSQTLDTDPLYSIFTSGSTGIPKGVLICHRSCLLYTSDAADEL